MKELELEARAKINLSLDVLYKRPDNYHELKMIMQTVRLHDTVTLQITGDGIEVASDTDILPSGGRNTAYKAAEAIIDRYGLKCGVKIDIKKRIPIAAGLAGGSSDAAAVLRGMNTLLELGLSEEELCRTGRLVGADVPYCILGGTMLAEGTGEVLTGLRPFTGGHVVLVKPGVSVSTAWVYGNLDLKQLGERPDTELLMKALEKGDIRTAAAGMRNVLESVTIPRYPEVSIAKARLAELGALGSMMSGSGPAVFGLFEDEETAARALSEVSKNTEWNCFLTQTV